MSINFLTKSFTVQFDSPILYNIYMYNRLCRISFSGFIFLCCPQQNQQAQASSPIKSPTSTRPIANNGRRPSGIGNNNGGFNSASSVINGGFNSNLGFSGQVASNNNSASQGGVVTADPSELCGISNEIRVIGGQAIRVSNA